jgi:hypothetical protein
MKTRGRKGRAEYRFVNSRVNSIVLKCLEILVERDLRVYEITSQSTIVYCFTTGGQFV